MREWLRAILSPHYEVLEPVTNGAELVQAAGRHQPDLIIVDILMPLLNGFEAVKQIQASGVSPMVVYFTTNASHAYVRRALNTGASAYILKGLAAEELLAAVREILEGRIFISPSIGYADSQP